MNISKYDFHDGFIIDLIQTQNNIKICMESAEIDANALLDSTLLLSSRKTLKGILHIQGIVEIKINDRSIYEEIKKEHDEGNIASFEIEQNHVKLLVEWLDYSLTSAEPVIWTEYDIKATNIYWENN